ncbi:unnamed protein product, partial [marine sediment metagenome]
HTVGAGASFRVGYCSNEWDGTYQYPDDWIGTLTTASSDDGSGPTSQAWTVYHDVDGSAGAAPDGYEVTDPFSSSSYYVRDYTLISTIVTSKHYDDSGNLLGTSTEPDADDIPPAADLDNIIMFTYVNEGDSFFEHDAVNGEIIVGGYRDTTKNVFSIDWMFLSKYLATEPSVSSVGDEQSQPGVNVPPTVESPNPSNGATDVSLSTTQLTVWINDTEGDGINWTIQTSPDIGSQDNSTAEEGNGSKVCTVSGLQGHTTYTWYVNVTDNGGGGWNNETYHFTTEFAPIDWWDTDYKNYRRITIESEYIDSDLTNFPVLVVLDNSTGDFTFHNAGADIEFVSLNSITQFNHEIESFDNAGDTFCWVNISETLTSGSDYSFLVYYDNSADSTVNHNPTGVWDNDFLAVYHMNEVSGNLVDSTANGNTGTAVGAASYSQTGKIGDCIVFDGNDYFTGVLPQADVSLTDGMFEFWEKTSNGVGLDIVVGWVHAGANRLYFGVDGDTSEWYTGWGSTYTKWGSEDTDWHYHAYRSDAGFTLDGYIDAATPAGLSVDSADFTQQNDLMIGTG